MRRHRTLEHSESDCFPPTHPILPLPLGNPVTISHQACRLPATSLLHRSRWTDSFSSSLSLSNSWPLNYIIQVTRAIKCNWQVRRKTADFKLTILINSRLIPQSGCLCYFSATAIKFCTRLFSLSVLHAIADAYPETQFQLSILHSYVSYTMV